MLKWNQIYVIFLGLANKLTNKYIFEDINTASVLSTVYFAYILIKEMCKFSHVLCFYKFSDTDCIFIFEDVNFDFETSFFQSINKNFCSP